METPFYALAKQLGLALSANSVLIASAESCTGGWICEVITAVPGSSAWFDRGFVSYSNAAKIAMLGVSADTLAAFGAVSEQTALEMLKGALAHSQAQCAIAVTGIAGPDGGSAEKPVGTVYIAWQYRQQPARVQRVNFSGDRQAIRAQTVQQALQNMLAEIPLP